jgi:hypothetical protein
MESIWHIFITKVDHGLKIQRETKTVAYTQEWFNKLKIQSIQYSDFQLKQLNVDYTVLSAENHKQIHPR